MSKFNLNYPPFLTSEIGSVFINYIEYDQCIYTVFLHTHTKNWDNNTFWIFRAFNSFWFTDIYGRLEIFRYLHILVLKSTFVERTLKMPKLSHQSKIQTWNCKKNRFNFLPQSCPAGKPSLSILWLRRKIWLRLSPMCHVYY